MYKDRGFAVFFLIVFLMILAAFVVIANNVITDQARANNEKLPVITNEVTVRFAASPIEDIELVGDLVNLQYTGVGSVYRFYDTVTSSTCFVVVSDTNVDISCVRGY